MPPGGAARLFASLLLLRRQHYALDSRRLLQRMKCVERASRLTTSTQCQSDLAQKIFQAQQQVAMHKSRSEALLQEYLANQGDPFGQPNYTPPIYSIPDLPSPDICQDVWIALGDAERLRQNYTAYAVLPHHLRTVLWWQKDLNPSAATLLGMLQAAIPQAQSLDSNLGGLLKAVCSLPPAVPMPPELTATNVFQKKVLGYNVCRWYHQWLYRTERDLGLLATKYPRQRQ